MRHELACQNDKEYLKNGCMEKFPDSLKLCCRVALDKKGADLKIFDMRGKSGLADFIVVTTCTSEPHINAMGWELYKEFKNQQGQLCKVDYKPLSGWFVLDSFDVIFHAFSKEMRESYHIEKIFQGVQILTAEEVLSIDNHIKS